MGNGPAERGLGLGPVGVDVNELMVERSVRKEIYSVLIDRHPIRDAEFAANKLGQFFLTHGDSHVVAP